MASRNRVDTSERTAPPGITELCVVVSDEEAASINIMGVVHDCMPVRQTKGKDLQITFVLRDESMSNNGLRIKCFRKSVDELPRVCQNGDVVLLRRLKISRYMNELCGLSSFQTEHVVFPLNSNQYSKSAKAQDPTTREQRWARQLRDFFSFENPKVSADKAAAPTPPMQPVQPLEPANRDKYSLIKNITAGERGTSAGKFYDLAGEVVKMFFNNWGYLDLYLCDYTVNKDLHEFKVGDPAGKTGRCPDGKMTLHVELQQPHASWTHENIKEGDFIRLLNVRIKWNQKGTGQELEGNMWSDRYYPDKVLVQPLHTGDSRLTDLKARKSSYFANVVNASEETKSMRRRKRNREKEAQKATQEVEERAAKRVKARESGIFMDDDASSEADKKATRDTKEHEGDISASEEVPKRSQPTRNKLNPHVTTSHSDIPWSSLDEIVDDRGRLLVHSNGRRESAPFNNVKHHANLRVIDFFPHQLRDFAIYEPDSSQGPWQWCFWLVLVSGDPKDEEEQAINVLVHGCDAQHLLQLDPSDLSKKKQLLEKLEERLFLLWGDLAEQKDKFLRSHPHILADETFSSKSHNIIAGNRSFECCIAEYGVEVPFSDDPSQDHDSNLQWMRVYKVFDTKINT